MMNIYKDVINGRIKELYGKNDIFSVVIMLKSVLTKNDFRDFANEVGYELDLLDGRIDVIPQSKILNTMGFPENWRDILEIN